MPGCHPIDVLVLGGGPAGFATAGCLVSRGAAVVVLAPEPREGPAVGECLAPSSRPLLQEAGVWDRFLEDGHRPWRGTVSVWGDGQPRFRGAISDPHGHGWHLDRGRFEGTLRRAAEEKGTVVVRDAATGVERDGTGWRVELRQKGRVSCRWLVDATGRSSWLARRLGQKRQREERQLAWFAFLARGEGPEPEPVTLVEAVEDGWWYSAPLPADRLVVSFTTDPDLHPPAQRRGSDWLACLRAAAHTSARVRSGGFRPIGPPRFVGACGGRLPHPLGPGWIAVGDAALSYDPLAGHGLTVALASARDAGQVVASDDHDGEAGRAYRDRLRLAHGLYARERGAVLMAESRWSRAPFWSRRRSRPPALGTAMTARYRPTVAAAG